MNLIQTSAERYKEIYFVTDDDIELIREAGEKIKDEMDNALEEYYAWMSFHPDLQQFFTAEVIHEFSKREQDLWLDLVLARIDNNFVKRQQEAINSFQQLGLPFEVYLSTLLAFHEVIENVFQRYKIGNFELLRAFKKIAGISLFIAIDVHNNSIYQTIKTQNDALSEMSTPVTQLWNSILFLPLVGIIDSRRAQNVMTAMLGKIAATQSKVFILDISGIAVMDTAVANYILKIIKATKLMGCQCIISGISSSVAQTVVELGIQTDEISTTGNMQAAVEMAFRLTGAKVISVL
jgi:rsbT co-antagonist protein RsbR